MSTDTVEGQAAAPQIDLVNAVTEMLMRNNHPNPEAWKAGLHPDVFNPETSPFVKRFLINRYWRMVLGRVVGEDTMNVRYCLVEQGELTDWIRIFEQGVLPCILRHNLPIGTN